MAESRALRLNGQAGTGQTPEKFYFGYQAGEEGIAEEPVGDAEAYFGPLGALGEIGGG
jgi:hypothetical protein